MYELEIINEDGTKQTNLFKSIRQMSIKTGLAYHNLKIILNRNNECSKSYKNTSVNILSKNIKISRKVPLIKILD